MKKIKQRLFKKGTIKKEEWESKKPFKFPNIYRLITDKIEKIKVKKLLSPKIVLFSVISLLLLVAIFVEGRNVYAGVQKKQESDRRLEKIAQQITYWKNITEKYKGYRDGYYQLALLSYQLGNKEESNAYLEKAFTLDPNFEEGRKLERVLSSKY